MTHSLFFALYSSSFIWLLKLLLCAALLAYILVAVIFSVLARSWKAGIVTTVLALVFGFIFTPWTSLQPITTSNPDTLTLNTYYRALAYLWIVCMMACVISIPGNRWLNQQFGAPVRRSRNPKAWWSPGTWIFTSLMEGEDTGRPRTNYSRWRSGAWDHMQSIRVESQVEPIPLNPSARPAKPAGSASARVPKVTEVKPAPPK